MLQQGRFEAVPDRARSTVWLRGDCEMGDVAAIHESVAALAADPSTAVVLDLTGLTFMGSSGLSALITLRAQYPKLRLHGVPDNFGRVLEVTSLDQVFTVV